MDERSPGASSLLVRLLLVDDHTLFRQSLSGVFSSEPGFEIVGEARTGEEALETLPEARPDVVLLDVTLPGISGIDTAAQIRSTFPDTGILMLSMHTEQQVVDRALQQGADGYALKEDTIEDLIYAIRSIQRGGRYISPTLLRARQSIGLAGGSDSSLRGESTRTELTERQREILLLVAQGGTNKTIAEQLGISQKTVENHRFNIAQQYGLTRAVDYVRYAIRKGWMRA